MTDGSPNSTLSPNQFRAQSVLNAITSFVSEFERRGEINALRQIIDQEENFLGGLVGQMPERFTKEQLITELLDALGYTNVTAEPADLVRDQRTIPDFQVGGIPDACTCIVEAKRFGKLPDPEVDTSDAASQIENYLGENALTKYKRDLDVQYLVGIATDGIVWILYAKSLESGRQAPVHAVSLRETYKQAVLARQFDDAVDERWNLTHRSLIEAEFVPQFGAANFLSAVESAVDTA